MNTITTASVLPSCLPFASTFVVDGKKIDGYDLMGKVWFENRVDLLFLPGVPDQAIRTWWQHVGAPEPLPFNINDSAQTTWTTGTNSSLRLNPQADGSHPYVYSPGTTSNKVQNGNAWRPYTAKEKWEMRRKENAGVALNPWAINPEIHPNKRDMQAIIAFWTYVEKNQYPKVEFWLPILMQRATTGVTSAQSSLHAQLSGGLLSKIPVTYLWHLATVPGVHDAALRTWQQEVNSLTRAYLVIPTAEHEAVEILTGRNTSRAPSKFTDQELVDWCLPVRENLHRLFADLYDPRMIDLPWKLAVHAVFKWKTGPVPARYGLDPDMGEYFLEELRPILLDAIKNIPC